MTLEAAREQLCAAMDRCTNMLESLIGPHDQMEEFLQSYAYTDYRAAERQAEDERDPETLRGLVAQMHAALDRWGR